MFTLCFTVHATILKGFPCIGHKLSCRTCLAREIFQKPISDPWPKKVVHDCTYMADAIIGYFANFIAIERIVSEVFKTRTAISDCQSTACDRQVPLTSALHQSCIVNEYIVSEVRILKVFTMITIFTK